MKGGDRMAFDLYKYQAEYTKKNLKRYEFKCLKEKEADMIQYLTWKGNVQAYVKELIRKDMEQNPMPVSEPEEWKEGKQQWHSMSTSTASVPQ